MDHGIIMFLAGLTDPKSYPIIPDKLTWGQSASINGTLPDTLRDTQNPTTTRKPSRPARPPIDLASWPE